MNKRKLIETLLDFYNNYRNFNTISDHLDLHIQNIHNKYYKLAFAEDDNEFTEIVVRMLLDCFYCLERT